MDVAELEGSYIEAREEFRMPYFYGDQHLEKNEPREFNYSITSPYVITFGSPINLSILIVTSSTWGV